MARPSQNTSNQGALTVGRRDAPWAAAGLAFVVLFGAGLVFADVLASPAFFEVDASSGQIDSFFVDNRPEAVWLSVFHALAAVALLAFGGYVSGVLRGSNGQAGGLAGVALAGASAAAAFLLLSASASGRSLARKSRKTTRARPRRCSYSPTSPAVPASRFPSLPFLAATSLAGLRARLLPRLVSGAGLAASALCLASVAGFAGDPTGDAGFDPGLGDVGIAFVVAAMLAALAWIATASLLLAGRRTQGSIPL